jgi:DNA-binding NarL/FixJ family response regulator
MQIAIIEDDTNYRECFVKGLNTFPDCTVVHSLSNALNIAKHFYANIPDIALIDINMPGLDGFEAVKEITQKFPTVQCIMLTINNDLDMVIKSMEIGAKGYLLKNKDSIVKIVDSMRMLHNGNFNEEFPLNGSLANRVLQHFVTKEKHTSEKLDEYQLTPRQKEVLKFLHQGKSYKLIAQECNISVETLNSHIRAIYPKLNIKSRGEISKFFNN